MNGRTGQATERAGGTSGRMPIFDESAEAGVIGSLLLDSGRVMPLLIERGFRPEHFYVPCNRQMFEAAVELTKANKIIDSLTLAERLKKAGKLEAVGGHARISAIMDDTPTAAHVEAYAEIVAQKAVLRNLIRIAQEVESSAYDGDVPVESIVASAQTEMFRLLGTVETVASNNDAILDLRDEWVDAREYRFRGLPCHIPSVARRLGNFKFGKVYFVGAASAGGKSTFMCNQVKHWAMGLGRCEAPVPVAVYSGEMTIGEILGSMICEHADVSKFALDNGMPDSHEDKAAGKTRLDRAILAAGDFVDPQTGADKIPLFITDREMNIDELEAWTRLMVMRHGIKALAVDYAQAIEPPPRFKGTEREKIVHIAHRLRVLAKSLNIVLLVLSQLSGEGGKAKRPTADELFGSKALQQVAGGIIMLYNDGGQDYCDIQKNRWGGTGAVEVTFEKSRQRWRDLADDPKAGHSSAGGAGHGDPL